MYYVLYIKAKVKTLEDTKSIKWKIKEWAKFEWKKKKKKKKQ